MAADDDKKLILARRAKFVAAALAGVSVACGKEPAPPPQPCLSQQISRDAEPPEPPPQPCLTPVQYDPDADARPTVQDGGAAPTGSDGGTTVRSQAPDAGTPPPKPTPCLAPPLPTDKPRPTPCLTPVRPPDKGAK